MAYFQNRADQIEYQAFRQALYPLGSGIVESGHDVVVTPRFKGAGQHWAPAHLNPLLVLRTILCSDRWAATWPLLWQRGLTQAAARRQAAGTQRRLAVVQVPPASLVAPPAAAPAPVAPVPPPARAAVPPRGRGRPAADHPWRASARYPSRRVG